MAHLLVIEPEAALREALAQALTDEGHQVTVQARLGALAGLGPRAPELIVLDPWPEDLAETATRLRAQPATAAIPILLCTAAADEAEQEAAALAPLGASVLVKPFELDDLLAWAEGAPRDRAAPASQPSTPLSMAYQRPAACRPAKTPHDALGLPRLCNSAARGNDGRATPPAACWRPRKEAGPCGA